MEPREMDPGDDDQEPAVMPDEVWKRSDKVILTGKDGSSVRAMILLVSDNQRSLAITFDGLLDGHEGFMPVLRCEDGLYRSVVSNTPVQIARMNRKETSVPRTIHKYPLRLLDRNTVAMPKGAIIRHVDMQAGQFWLWCEVDTEAPDDLRVIDIYATGQAMPDDPGTFIGTFLTPEGQFVWHVYEAALDPKV